MDREVLIKLCLAVYRVTEVFPEREPLRFSIREKANQILADLVCGEQKKRAKEQILGNIEVLKGYFEVAEAQKWLPEENFLVLLREYDKIRKELKARALRGEKGDKSDGGDLGLAGQAGLKERQRKILEVLREKQQAQIQDFKEIFPQVAKRTLRRDFEYLLRQGLVERIGQKNDTFYRIGRTG